MKLQQGFTLIELMATIGIATILLAVATPSFIAQTRNSRIIGYTNDLVATLNFTRSEAIRRGAGVSVCHSNDRATCSGTWGTGWIVFADPNSNRTVDTGETILKTFEGISAGYGVGASSDYSAGVTYGADGSAHKTGTFAICKGTDVKNSRAIIVSRLRARVARDADQNKIPDLDSGELASCTSP